MGEGTGDAGEAFRRELEARVPHEPLPRRRQLLVGLLVKHLDARSRDRPVLVGGGAVELYSAGAYTTGDVDLVGRRALIDPLLRAAGFERTGRHYHRDDLGLVLEVPGRFLRDTEEVVEVEVEDLVVPTVRVEDVLVDRLLAAKFWDSPTDWEQAVILYAAHEDRFDVEALEAKARANDVLDRLRELRRTVADVG